MIAVVIELVETPKKIKSGDYSVKVKAMNLDGKIFDYQFVKNKIEEANKIIQGYSWEMLSKRKWF